MGYLPKNILLNSTVSVAQSQTNSVISNEFGITAEGSRGIRIDMRISAITVAAAITVKLQHKSITDWADVAVASVTPTTTGESSIVVLDVDADEQGDVPLKHIGRIVCTTGAGDSITFSHLILLQPT